MTSTTLTPSARCYQDFPAALLPEVLRDDNPHPVPRLIDGKRA